MFCPDCGLEDKQSNQFCRSCGTDLRQVRNALERPDKITASAASARDEIGRAIAAKIRDSRGPEDLAVVAEDVLPELEKFLESPQEKRLRRLRAGTIVSSVGIGTAVGFGLASAFVGDRDFLLFAGLGIVCFFIGLGIILNGLFLTIPRKELPDRQGDADRQRALDLQSPAETNDLVLPEAREIFSSVTEPTTQHLQEKAPIHRKSDESSD